MSNGQPRKAGTNLNDDKTYQLLRPGGTFAATLVGCAVGPDYHRPETKAPSTWDGQNTVTPANPSKTTSIR